MRVQRFDIGTLSSPKETPQGFLIVEGYASRTGIFEYQRADGSIQRELRTDEEVFAPKALKGYEGASLTSNHPSAAVTPFNARRLSVGTVLEPAKKDGNRVKVRMVIKDADAIEGARDGSMRALSTGYAVDLVMTPGVHPEFGRYDAIQTNLEINHLALCPAGRAGPIAKVKMDSVANDAMWAALASGLKGQDLERAQRADAGVMVSSGAMLTTIVEGHQHSVDPSTMENGVGTTSWANAEGEDYGHSHEFVRKSDGSYTIAVNEGHTHELVAESAPTNDASGNNRKGTKMPPASKPEDKTTVKTDDKTGTQPAKPAAAHPNEKNRLDAANELIGRANARADAAETKLKEETARADAADGEAAAWKKKFEDADAERTDVAAVQERDDKIQALEVTLQEQKTKIDELEKPERVTKLVRDRVEIEKKAAPILGHDNFAKMDDQEIMVAVVEKMQSDSMAGKSPDYVRARFDIAVGQHSASARAYAQISSAAKAPVRTDVKSARDTYLETQKTGWKPTTQKGA